MDIRDKKMEVLELLSQTNDSGIIEKVYDILHPEAAISDAGTEQQQQHNYYTNIKGKDCGRFHSPWVVNPYS